ncbi:fumarylacetoacetate hydrolase family protein [Gluconobacter morbifer]|uniref:Putative fumarylacetoacetate (FAA) hydrolase protein n=1 Tax=Gluconobacter morbifer G707 TaxID=1088869 RepID=G6XJX6_9PROT|nr:fumarylacetoacetate hydrolase family protein [Gluconobacter morbifer]EHH67938.1 putative fumarylacetoacetate (FAA) hydrolase protein [Gluconobacter morbifer G707]
MKLCRFGPAGQEKPGLIDLNGRLRSLAGHLETIDVTTLAPDRLAALARIDRATLPVVEETQRYGLPFTGSRKYIGIGLNYSDHAREAGMATPSEPVIFLKAISALCGPDEDIIQPSGSTKLDWEVELAVIIGTQASRVSRDQALDHVAGYCIANDVSERGFQLQSSQWDKGKGCDTFGPVGPWLVTKEDVPDPQVLELWLDVNGHRMQHGTTRNMIFDVRTIVSYVSQYMTLTPGDIIATGTPAGVGMGVRPDPVYLKVGDRIELGIEGLGSQRQKVVALS